MPRMGCLTVTATLVLTVKHFFSRGWMLLPTGSGCIVLTKRRSINFFDSGKEVSEDQLTKIVEAASNVPSSFNLQPWNLMVLRNLKEKEKLKTLARDQPKVVEAPVILIVLAEKTGWQEGHPVFEKNWESPWY